MNPEMQNIAIAEACGWKRDPIYGAIGVWNKGPIPDYLNDLNAMHEAEKGLIFSKRQTFRIELQRVMSKAALGIDFCAVEISECIHATAAHRAEAFLRTIGKWEESEC